MEGGAFCSFGKRCRSNQDSRRNDFFWKTCYSHGGRNWVVLNVRKDSTHPGILVIKENPLVLNFNLWSCLFKKGNPLVNSSAYFSTEGFLHCIEFVAKSKRSSPLTSSSWLAMELVYMCRLRSALPATLLLLNYYFFFNFPGMCIYCTESSDHRTCLHQPLPSGIVYFSSVLLFHFAT